MRENLEYSSDDVMIRIRIYMNDGVLAGIAVSNPSDSTQYGYAAVNDAGYTFWINDFSYSEYEEIKDQPPAHKDIGARERYEFCGELRSSASGISGDLRIKARASDDEFYEKLLTFTDLNLQTTYGRPAITGKINVKMRDIFDAFYGKGSSGITFVWQMAYAMDDLDNMPFIKNLDFGLELDSTANDYSMKLKAADSASGSSIALSFRAYMLSKSPEPLRGERFDIANASPEAVVGLLNDVMGNLDTKLDELLYAGYDLTWVKPLIRQMLAGGGLDGGIMDGTPESGEGYDLTGYMGYIFENSSVEEIDPDILPLLPPELLMIARNEIFARNGWVFNDIDLQMYFNQQDWYVPLYDNDSITLNEIEVANIEAILKAEGYNE
jgi:hypothetical protein